MERTPTMIFFCVYAEIDMDQKLAFYRGFNAPTQISKYIRGFYSAGSARSSTKSAPNMVYDHAFRTIITKQPSWHTLSAT